VNGENDRNEIFDKTSNTNPNNMEENMEWLSWTSPLGVSLFILSISLAFYLFTQAVHTLSKAGKTGKEIENMK